MKEGKSTINLIEKVLDVYDSKLIHHTIESYLFWISGIAGSIGMQLVAVAMQNVACVMRYAFN